MGFAVIQQTGQLWKSLEIATMILALLTPIVIAMLAFRFNRNIKGLIKKQWSNQKIVEKRIEVYDRIVPKLNDIFCFFSYNGNWKEITPLDILRYKRELDKDMNIYASLFSDDMGKKYADFTGLCYVSRSGWEHDEKIKSLYTLRQEQNLDWSNDWIQYFDTNNVVEAIKIKERYDELMQSYKKELEFITEIT